jgi:ABC-2 type transport system ATP-binding protein
MTSTGSTSDPVIEVSELRKEYGSTVAVDGVSFEVRSDEVFGLLGPNGAGKTTVVELLQGLRAPTAGDVVVLGHRLPENRRAVAERVGVVPQSFHTFERLTVRENVALVGSLHGGSRPVDDVLSAVGLDEYADERFGALSGGYRRRTGVAMALVSDPEVLFLDEPTAGLDPAARRSTWQLVDKLPDLGTAVVLTTHYMDEVEYLADRVALLVDGSVEAVDSVSKLVDAYAGEVRVVVDVAAPVDEQFVASCEAILADAADSVHRTGPDDLVGVFSDRHRAQDVFAELHDLGGRQSIDLVSSGMEDVFLEVTGETLDAEAGDPP